MRSTRFWAAVATAALTTTALTACGGDSPEENADQACSAWDTYSAAVDDLISTLTSDDPTVGAVQDAREAVDDAYDDLEGAAKDVAEDRTQTVEDAWDDLESAVDDVDDDDTLSQARAALSDQAAEVRQAADGLHEELGCS